MGHGDTLGSRLLTEVCVAPGVDEGQRRKCETLRAQGRRVGRLAACPTQTEGSELHPREGLEAPPPLTNE